MARVPSAGTVETSSAPALLDAAGSWAPQHLPVHSQLQGSFSPSLTALPAPWPSLLAVLPQPHSLCPCCSCCLEHHPDPVSLDNSCISDSSSNITSSRNPALIFLVRLEILSPPSTSTSPFGHFPYLCVYIDLIQELALFL